ncbi:family 43 glycosylhydrolase [Salegentibacter sp. 24]|uniref:family 43 glycosylhydrolase n=1 Tax=Salegentibacter sp. 24 TaxID=2183986 RepID=UPI001FB6D8DD|nr:family 43 glycosylhydrolase [Salegentibacter sp. 24]
MDQFTADPTARVFNGKLYVYPSHDIVPPEGEGRPEWFNMADYHVFSTENLTQWKDHGKILDQKDVPWADSEAYSMWAPDAVERNDKYYFYFPTRTKGAGDGEGGFSIGVAVSNTPTGPFIPQRMPIEGVEGIDPNVLIDKTGQAYLYWSRGKIYGAKLKDNMLELASKPKVFTELPQKGHIEGPFVFERKGTYYMTYPHVANQTERLEYATGDNPLGPFIHKGVIMDESSSGTWTNHHSVVNYKDQWYLFYHDSELSPDFDKNRSIRADSLFFKENGNIKKVIPTHRGIGKSSAFKQIQFDRYSEKSEEGVHIEYLDQKDTFKGWKLVFTQPGAKVRYNRVEFGKESPKAVKLRVNVSGDENAVIEIFDSSLSSVAKLQLDSTDGWEEISVPVQHQFTGTKDLLIEVSGKGSIELDWIEFVK